MSTILGPATVHLNTPVIGGLPDSLLLMGTGTALVNLPCPPEAQNALSRLSFSGIAPGFLCRAWIQFNSTGGIVGSGNVTSVARFSAGVFRVHFTTPLLDWRFAAIGNSGGVAGHSVSVSYPTPPFFDPAACDINTWGASGTAHPVLMDAPITCVAFFR